MKKWEGWIKLHRKLCINDLWLSEPFTRGQAWVDLILLANHEPGHIRVRGIRIEIERGQVGWSINTLSNRWGWSRNKTTKFLEELEKIEQQIKVDKSKLSTIITIVNYKEYQKKKSEEDNKKTTEEQENEQQKVKQKDTNKKLKEVSLEVKEDLTNICSPESDELFETFWKEYPRKAKGAKKSVIKGYFTDKGKRSIEDQRLIVEGMRVYADYWEENRTEERHRKMPQGFINGDYWKPEQLPETRKRKYKDQAQKRDPNWVNPFMVAE